MSGDGALRLDKWLWAARFFKTRSLATAAVVAGEVRVGGERVKPARAVKVGDVIEVRRSNERLQIAVRALSDVRGPALVAQRLYEESEESVAARTQRRAERVAFREPAVDIRGRPTKRDARVLRKLRGDS